MKNFEKIEIVVKGRLRERKKELERSKSNHNPLCVLGMEHNVSTLSIIATDIEAIKNNQP